jgi:hypothetical protein
MRKVYLDADSLDLVLVPTRPEYEFVFIQTEGKCIANIKLKPFPDTKFKVKIYLRRRHQRSRLCLYIRCT